MSQDFNPQNQKNNSSLSIEQLQKQLLKQQDPNTSNFPMSIMAGLLAATGGAVIWAGITYATGYQIGWMAIGIGFLVGFTIKKVGNSTEIQFGIAGGVLSLLGCILGNLFTTIIIIANQESIGIFEVLFELDFTTFYNLMIETFSPMDLMFYGFAVYYGYKYAIEAEKTNTQKDSPTPQPPIQS